jgi:hypothetical protein
MMDWRVAEGLPADWTRSTEFFWIPDGWTPIRPGLVH